MANFTIETSLENGVLWLRPNGYLEKSAGESLRREIERFLPQGVSRCLITFSGVSVINSPGVAMLLELAETMHYDHHIPLGFLALSDLYTEVFQTVGLLELVRVFPDENTARTSP